MEELISTVVERVGLDRSLAEKAIAVVLDLIKSHGPSAGADQLIAALPGAGDLLARSGGSAGEDETSAGAGGMLAGALGAMGGGNPLMATLAKLQAIGLDVDQARGVGRQVIGFARSKADPDLVDQFTQSIPGLSAII